MNLKLTSTKIVFAINGGGIAVQVVAVINLMNQGTTQKKKRPLR